MQPSMAKCAWFAPNPRMAPHGGLFVYDRDRLDVDVRDAVRAAAVTRRPLEHLPADRRIGAAVADHSRLHGREAPVGVAADGVVHRDRVALRVKANRLLARQHRPHRPARQPREQRGLGLDGHVLLAAEGAAVGHQLDVDRSSGSPRNPATWRRSSKMPCPWRIEAKRAVRQTLGQRGFGLEVEVLDPLRLPGSADDVRTRSEGRVGVTSTDDRLREQVLRASGSPAAPTAPATATGSSTGGSSFVLHVDQRRRLSRHVRVLGRDRGEHVADAPDLFARRRRSRASPRTASPYQRRARHVRGGGHADDARVRPRAGGVDPNDPCTGVRRQDEGAVQQAGAIQVGDVRTRAERQSTPRRTRDRRVADAAVRRAGPEPARRGGSLAINSMASTIFV